jgi:hypothetical protein
MKRNTTRISMLAFLALLIPLGFITVEARPPDDFEPPVIQFIFPTRNNYPLAGDMFISIRAFDNSGIQNAWCHIDGHIELPCSSRHGDKFWFSIETTNFADGAHQITVYVADNAPIEPNIGQKSITVQIKNHEKIAPYAKILSPIDGATLQLGRIYVKFKTYDNVRLKDVWITLYDRNWNIEKRLHSEFINAYSYDVAILYAPLLLEKSGQHVIRLSICDYADNYAYDTIIVQVGLHTI